ncbi:MAG: hypothetical protein GX589_06840 [Deltaproteobacteria bacterium]|nr:hypothetical protein [Deltaproteobacteria bacterium]
MLLAFVAQVLVGGDGLVMPSWPLNGALNAAFICALLLLHFLKPRFSVIKALTKIPLALASMAMFFSLCIIAGIVPQGDRVGGIAALLKLSQITTSLPFAVAGVILMTCLGLTVLSRLWPFRLKNLPFLLNHLGLFLIINGMYFGAGDFRRGMIMLSHENFVNRARDEQGRSIFLPFALKLNSFSIDHFPVELTLLKTGSGELAPKRVQSRFVLPAGKLQLGDWRVSIDEFLEEAREDGEGGFVGISGLGVVSAARVSAINDTTSKQVSGWVCTRGTNTSAQSLVLNERETLLLEAPKPRQYRSELKVKLGAGEGVKDIVVEVNHPGKLGGWQLYQASYDVRAGAHSRVSGIEVVRDPWLPVVYAGIFMLMAGSLQLLRQKSLFGGVAR